MKTIIIVVVVIVGLIGGAVLISSPDSNPEQVAGTTSSQNFADIQQSINQGAQLIDVRTAEEYADGHIDGAINLSLQDIQAGTMPSVDKNQTIYVYCHSGNRSSQATALLTQAGYTNIVDLGAMTHVQSLGGTIVSGS